MYGKRNALLIDNGYPQHKTESYKCVIDVTGTLVLIDSLNKLICSYISKRWTHNEYEPYH